MANKITIPEGQKCSPCRRLATGIWGAGKAGGIFICESCATRLDAAYMIDSLEGVVKVNFGYEALADQGMWYYTNCERLCTWKNDL